MAEKPSRLFSQLPGAQLKLSSKQIFLERLVWSQVSLKIIYKELHSYRKRGWSACTKQPNRIYASLVSAGLKSLRSGQTGTNQITGIKKSNNDDRETIGI